MNGKAKSVQTPTLPSPHELGITLRGLLRYGYGGPDNKYFRELTSGEHIQSYRKQNPISSEDIWQFLRVAIKEGAQKIREAGIIKKEYETTAPEALMLAQLVMDMMVQFPHWFTEQRSIYDIRSWNELFDKIARYTNEFFANERLDGLTPIQVAERAANYITAKLFPDVLEKDRVVPPLLQDIVNGTILAAIQPQVLRAREEQYMRALKLLRERGRELETISEIVPPSPLANEVADILSKWDALEQNTAKLFDQFTALVNQRAQALAELGTRLGEQATAFGIGAKEAIKKGMRTVLQNMGEFASGTGTGISSQDIQKTLNKQAAKVYDRQVVNNFYGFSALAGLLLKDTGYDIGGIEEVLGLPLSQVLGIKFEEGQPHLKVLSFISAGEKIGEKSPIEIIGEYIDVIRNLPPHLRNLQAIQAYISGATSASIIGKTLITEQGLRALMSIALPGAGTAAAITIAGRTVNRAKVIKRTFDVARAPVYGALLYGSVVNDHNIFFLSQVNQTVQSLSDEEIKRASEIIKRRITAQVTADVITEGVSLFVEWSLLLNPIVRAATAGLEKLTSSLAKNPILGTLAGRVLSQAPAIAEGRLKVVQRLLTDAAEKWSALEKAVLAGDFTAAKGIVPELTEIGKKLLKPYWGSYLLGSARQAAFLTGVAMMEEGLEEVGSILAEYFLLDERTRPPGMELFGEEMLQDMKRSFVAGAAGGLIMGGTLGSAASLMNGLQMAYVTRAVLYNFASDIGRGVYNLMGKLSEKTGFPSTREIAQSLSATAQLISYSKFFQLPPFRTRMMEFLEINAEIAEALLGENSFGRFIHELGRAVEANRAEIEQDEAKRGALAAMESLAHKAAAYKLHAIAARRRLFVNKEILSAIRDLEQKADSLLEQLAGIVSAVAEDVSVFRSNSRHLNRQLRSLEKAVQKVVHSRARQLLRSGVPVVTLTDFIKGEQAAIEKGLRPFSATLRGNKYVPSLPAEQARDYVRQTGERALIVNFTKEGGVAIDYFEGGKEIISKRISPFKISVEAVSKILQAVSERVSADQPLSVFVVDDFWGDTSILDDEKTREERPQIQIGVRKNLSDFILGIQHYRLFFFAPYGDVHAGYTELLAKSHKKTRRQFRALLKKMSFPAPFEPLGNLTMGTSTGFYIGRGTDVSKFTPAALQAQERAKVKPPKKEKIEEEKEVAVGMKIMEKAEEKETEKIEETAVKTKETGKTEERKTKETGKIEERKTEEIRGAIVKTTAEETKKKRKKKAKETKVPEQKKPIEEKERQRGGRPRFSLTSYILAITKETYYRTFAAKRGLGSLRGYLDIDVGIGAISENLFGKEAKKDNSDALLASVAGMLFLLIKPPISVLIKRAEGGEARKFGDQLIGWHFLPLARLAYVLELFHRGYASPAAVTWQQGDRVDISLTDITAEKIGKADAIRDMLEMFIDRYAGISQTEKTRLKKNLKKAWNELSEAVAPGVPGKGTRPFLRDFLEELRDVRNRQEALDKIKEWKEKGKFLPFVRFFEVANEIINKLSNRVSIKVDEVRRVNDIFVYNAEIYEVKVGKKTFYFFRPLDKRLAILMPLYAKVNMKAEGKPAPLNEFSILPQGAKFRRTDTGIESKTYNLNGAIGLTSLIVFNPKTSEIEVSLDAFIQNLDSEVLGQMVPSEGYPLEDEQNNSDTWVGKVFSSSGEGEVRWLRARNDILKLLKIVSEDFKNLSAVMLPNILSALQEFGVSVEPFDLGHIAYGETVGNIIRINARLFKGKKDTAVRVISHEAGHYFLELLKMLASISDDAAAKIGQPDIGKKARTLYERLINAVKSNPAFSKTIQRLQEYYPGEGKAEEEIIATVIGALFARHYTTPMMRSVIGRILVKARNFLRELLRAILEFFGIKPKDNLRDVARQVMDFIYENPARMRLLYEAISEYESILKAIYGMAESVSYLYTTDAITDSIMQAIIDALANIESGRVKDQELAQYAADYAKRYFTEGELPRLIKTRYGFTNQTYNELVEEIVEKVREFFGAPLTNENALLRDPETTGIAIDDLNEAHGLRRIIPLVQVIYDTGRRRFSVKIRPVSHQVLTAIGGAFRKLSPEDLDIDKKSPAELFAFINNILGTPGDERVAPDVNALRSYFMYLMDSWDYAILSDDKQLADAYLSILRGTLKTLVNLSMGYKSYPIVQIRRGRRGGYIPELTNVRRATSGVSVMRKVRLNVFSPLFESISPAIYNIFNLVYTTGMHEKQNTGKRKVSYTASQVLDWLFHGKGDNDVVAIASEIGNNINVIRQKLETLERELDKIMKELELAREDIRPLIEDTPDYEKYMQALRKWRAHLDVISSRIRETLPSLMESVPIADPVVLMNAFQVTPGLINQLNALLQKSKDKSKAFKELFAILNKNKWNISSIEGKLAPLLRDIVLLRNTIKNYEKGLIMYYDLIKDAFYKPVSDALKYTHQKVRREIKAKLESDERVKNIYKRLEGAKVSKDTIEKLFTGTIWIKKITEAMINNRGTRIAEALIANGLPPIMSSSTETRGTAVSMAVLPRYFWYVLEQATERWRSTPLERMLASFSKWARRVHYRLEPLGLNILRIERAFNIDSEALAGNFILRLAYTLYDRGKINSLISQAGTAIGWREPVRGGKRYETRFVENPLAEQIGEGKQAHLAYYILPQAADSPSTYALLWFRAAIAPEHLSEELAKIVNAIRESGTVGRLRAGLRNLHTHLKEKGKDAFKELVRGAFVGTFEAFAEELGGFTVDDYINSLERYTVKQKKKKVSLLDVMYQSFLDELEAVDKELSGTLPNFLGEYTSRLKEEIPIEEGRFLRGDKTPITPKTAEYFLDMLLGYNSFLNIYYTMFDLNPRLQDDISEAIKRVFKRSSILNLAGVPLSQSETDKDGPVVIVIDDSLAQAYVNTKGQQPDQETIEKSRFAQNLTDGAVFVLNAREYFKRVYGIDKGVGMQHKHTIYSPVFGHIKGALFELTEKNFPELYRLLSSVMDYFPNKPILLVSKSAIKLQHRDMPVLKSVFRYVKRGADERIEIASQLSQEDLETIRAAAENPITISYRDIYLQNTLHVSPYTQRGAIPSQLVAATSALLYRNLPVEVASQLVQKITSAYGELLSPERVRQALSIADNPQKIAEELVRIFRTRGNQLWKAVIDLARRLVYEDGSSGLRELIQVLLLSDIGGDILSVISSAVEDEAIRRTYSEIKYATVAPDPTLPYKRIRISKSLYEAMGNPKKLIVFRIPGTEHTITVTDDIEVFDDSDNPSNLVFVSAVRFKQASEDADGDQVFLLPVDTPADEKLRNFLQAVAEAWEKAYESRPPQQRPYGHTDPLETPAAPTHRIEQIINAATTLSGQNDVSAVLRGGAGAIGIAANALRILTAIGPGGRIRILGRGNKPTELTLPAGDGYKALLNIFEILLQSTVDNPKEPFLGALGVYRSLVPVLVGRLFTLSVEELTPWLQKTPREALEKFTGQVSQAVEDTMRILREAAANESLDKKVRRKISELVSILSRQDLRADIGVRVFFQNLRKNSPLLEKLPDTDRERINKFIEWYETGRHLLETWTGVVSMGRELPNTPESLALLARTYYRIKWLYEPLAKEGQSWEDLVPAELSVYLRNAGVLLQTLYEKFPLLRAYNAYLLSREQGETIAKELVSASPDKKIYYGVQKRPLLLITEDTARRLRERFLRAIVWFGGFQQPLAEMEHQSLVKFARDVKAWLDKIYTDPLLASSISWERIWIKEMEKSASNPLMLRPRNRTPSEAQILQNFISAPTASTVGTLQNVMRLLLLARKEEGSALPQYSLVSWHMSYNYGMNALQNEDSPLNILFNVPIEKVALPTAGTTKADHQAWENILRAQVLIRVVSSLLLTEEPEVEVQVMMADEKGKPISDKVIAKRQAKTITDADIKDISEEQREPVPLVHILEEISIEGKQIKPMAPPLRAALPFYVCEGTLTIGDIELFYIKHTKRLPQMGMREHLLKRLKKAVWVGWPGRTDAFRAIHAVHIPEIGAIVLRIGDRVTAIEAPREELPPEEVKVRVATQLAQRGPEIIANATLDEERGREFTRPRYTVKGAPPDVFYAIVDVPAIEIITETGEVIIFRKTGNKKELPLGNFIRRIQIPAPYYRYEIIIPKFLKELYLPKIKEKLETNPIEAADLIRFAVGKHLKEEIIKRVGKEAEKPVSRVIDLWLGEFYEIAPNEHLLRAFVEALEKDITQGPVYAIEYARTDEVETDNADINRQINTFSAVRDYYAEKWIWIEEWLKGITDEKKLVEAFTQRMLGGAVTIQEVKSEELPPHILARTIFADGKITMHVKAHDSLLSVPHEVMELVIRGLLRVGDKAAQTALAQAKRYLAQRKSKQQRKTIPESSISDDEAIEFLAEMTAVSAVKSMNEILKQEELGIPAILRHKLERLFVREKPNIGELHEWAMYIGGLAARNPHYLAPYAIEEILARLAEKYEERELLYLYDELNPEKLNEYLRNIASIIDRYPDIRAKAERLIQSIELAEEIETYLEKASSEELVYQGLGLAAVSLLPQSGKGEAIYKLLGLPDDASAAAVPLILGFLRILRKEADPRRAWRTAWQNILKEIQHNVEISRRKLEGKMPEADELFDKLMQVVAAGIGAFMREHFLIHKETNTGIPWSMARTLVQLALHYEGSKAWGILKKQLSNEDILAITAPPGRLIFAFLEKYLGSASDIAQNALGPAAYAIHLYSMVDHNISKEYASRFAELDELTRDFIRKYYKKKDAKISMRQWGGTSLQIPVKGLLAAWLHYNYLLSRNMRHEPRIFFVSEEKERNKIKRVPLLIIPENLKKEEIEKYAKKAANILSSEKGGKIETKDLIVYTLEELENKLIQTTKGDKKPSEIRQELKELEDAYKKVVKEFDAVHRRLFKDFYGVEAPLPEEVLTSASPRLVSIITGTIDVPQETPTFKWEEGELPVYNTVDVGAPIRRALWRGARLLYVHYFYKIMKEIYGIKVDRNGNIITNDLSDLAKSIEASGLTDFHTKNMAIGIRNYAAWLEELIRIEQLSRSQEEAHPLFKLSVSVLDVVIKQLPVAIKTISSVYMSIPRILRDEELTPLQKGELILHALFTIPYGFGGIALNTFWYILKEVGIARGTDPFGNTLIAHILGEADLFKGDNALIKTRLKELDKAVSPYVEMPEALVNLERFLKGPFKRLPPAMRFLVWDAVAKTIATGNKALSVMVQSGQNAAEMVSLHWARLRAENIVNRRYEDIKDEKLKKKMIDDLAISFYHQMVLETQPASSPLVRSRHAVERGSRGSAFIYGTLLMAATQVQAMTANMYASMIDIASGRIYRGISRLTGVYLTMAAFLILAEVAKAVVLLLRGLIMGDDDDKEKAEKILRELPHSALAAAITAAASLILVSLGTLAAGVAGGWAAFLMVTGSWIMGLRAGQGGIYTMTKAIVSDEKTSSATQALRLLLERFSFAINPAVEIVAGLAEFFMDLAEGRLTEEKVAKYGRLVSLTIRFPFGYQIATAERWHQQAEREKKGMTIVGLPSEGQMNIIGLPTKTKKKPRNL